MMQPDAKTFASVCHAKQTGFIAAQNTVAMIISNSVENNCHSKRIVSLTPNSKLHGSFHRDKL
jgi:hypothetical protein